MRNETVVDRVQTWTSDNNGKRVWWASCRNISRSGETELEALGNLEAALDATSDCPIYLTNF